MNLARKFVSFVFPSSRSASPSRNGDHHKSSTKARAALISERCGFTFSDGRKCGMRRAQFCVHHSSKGKPGPKAADPGPNTVSDAAFGASALEALCVDLTTATKINRALTQVFLLMAQGRISQKQAVAFGYLTQLLLQTVPGIRSEYVSVHGYDAWENKLKALLTPNTPTPPDLSPEGGENNQAKQPTIDVVEPKKAVGITAFFRTEKVERQKGLPITPFLPHERVPDYTNLFRRGRDLLDGKYDTTPEGRRQANALSLELELMKPPSSSKPPKDFRGRVVDLVRRWSAHSKSSRAETAGPPNSAPQTSANAPEPPSTATHAPPHCEAGHTPAIAVPSEHRESRAPSNSFPIVVAEKSAPSRSPAPRAPGRSGSPPRATDAVEAPPPVPASVPAATAHASGWFAPLSWAKPGTPDPFPGRKEKLRRSLRTMGDRRRQHQMQNRSFWR